MGTSRYNDVPSLSKYMQDLERRVKDLENSQGLAVSSVDNGTLVVSETGGIQLGGETTVQNNPIKVLDENDTVVQVIGLQSDGSYGSSVYDGPVPVAPTDPILEPRPGGLVVRWDGAFINETPAPLDFARVEIHVSQTEGFAPDGATIVNSFTSVAPAEIFIPLVSELWYVKLVTRSTPGIASELSNEISGTPLPSIDAELIEQEVSSRLKVTRSMSEPVGEGSGSNEQWWQIDSNNDVVARWSWDVDTAVWTPMRTSGVLIAAETISAAQIAADAISADKILAGAITTAKLAALAITADKIAANSITADKLTSTLVLGTKIVAGDAAGSRVELGTFGLRKYAANGTTVQVDFTGATAVFSGQVSGADIIGSRFRTAETGARIDIRSSSNGTTSAGSVSFYRAQTTNPWGYFGYVSNATEDAAPYGTDQLQMTIGGDTSTQNSSYRRGTLSLAQVRTAEGLVSRSQLSGVFNSIKLTTSYNPSGTSTSSQGSTIGSIGLQTGVFGVVIQPTPSGPVNYGSTYVGNMVYQVLDRGNTPLDDFARAWAYDSIVNNVHNINTNNVAYVETPAAINYLGVSDDISVTGRLYKMSYTWYAEYNYPTVDVTIEQVSGPMHTTAWIPITLSSAWAAYSTAYTPQYRIYNNTMYLAGLVKYTGSTAPSDGNIIYQMADMLPYLTASVTRQFFTVQAGNGTDLASLAYRQDIGALTYRAGTYSPWISLDSLSFPVRTSISYPKRVVTVALR